MDDWFPQVRGELERFRAPHRPSLKPLEWVEIPENCNWKVSVENYSECYHCTLNHPTFATGRDQARDLRHPAAGLLPAPHHPERQSRPHELPDRQREQQHAGDYSSWFLWPMFSFQVYPGNLLNTYHWRAVDADHVVVWRGWYTIDGVDSETVRRLAIQDRATTVEEDIHLVESVQRGLKSRGYARPAGHRPEMRVNSEHSVMPCSSGCGRPMDRDAWLSRSMTVTGKTSSTANLSMAARADRRR
jgi:phenylpropionate dioxygenase-like ring-hydroxylating dioxygenase large terminal subunit